MKFNLIEELGLLSIYSSPRDTKLLCAQRFARLFAYGGSTIVLVLYLKALDISDERIGAFMTLTLWGDVVISLGLTVVADALGRKMILAGGALLMAASGIVFATMGNYWVLLLAAIFGVISPSGNEIGPFRAIEESVLAQLTPPANRSDIYAWYSLIGMAGTAFGIMTAGWTVEQLQKSARFSDVQAYRTVFYFYTLLGLVKLALSMALSEKVEVERKPPPSPDQARTQLLHDYDAETEGSNNNNRDTVSKNTKTKPKAWLPAISPASRLVVIQLCILFGMDSFASGLATLSWLSYFFNYKFGLKEGKLGTLFFVSTIVASLSQLVASSISKRIGNVKTMVFTHLPSAIFLALIPVPPYLPLAMILLILRACTQSMDVGPRSAFLAAVILPAERTAVMGVLNVVKTASQSIGPFLTGTLVTHSLFWVVFLLAGALKVSYDLGVLFMFQNHKTPGDLAAERRTNEQIIDSEDEEGM